MIKTIKREKYFLLTIFFLSFIVRSFVFYFYLSKDENYWQVDSNTYHKIAVSISQGQGIGIDGKPQFYRLPGYSIFLSIYYSLFGVDTKNVLWLQIFLASFIPLMICFLSLVLFPSHFLLAKLSSLYSCFHLGLVLYAGFFMTESLFILFLLLFFILFFSSVHLYSRLFFAGIFLGVASLIRPVGHYLIVLSVLLLLFSRGAFTYRLKKSLVLFLGWILVVFWWLLRNFLLTGYVFFHTLPGGHFLYLSAARVAMHPQNCSYWQARSNLSKEVEILKKRKEKLLKKTLSEIELCHIREQVAIKYFKKYPFLALKNWFTDMIRTSLSLYSAELVLLDHNREGIPYFAKGRPIWDMFKRYLPPKVSSNMLLIVIFLEMITFLFILIGFFLGLVRSVFVFYKSDINQKGRLMFCSWARVLPLMAIFIIVGLSGGFNRMRLPAEPFLIILSFSFWLWLLQRKIARKNSWCC